MAIVAAVLAACGGESSAPAENGTTDKPAATTVSSNALPAERVGTWRLVDPDLGDVVRLYLRPTAYTLSRGFAHTGQAEAEGDVLTLTSTCGESSITGTGHYRWKLSGDTLHLELIGKDKCSGRPDAFDAATYERSG